MISILKKYSIKILQVKHEKLIDKALTFLNTDRDFSYAHIEKAERVATKIQHIKKYDPWS